MGSTQAHWTFSRGHLPASENQAPLPLPHFQPGGGLEAVAAVASLRDLPSLTWMGVFERFHH